ncbi:MAG: nucleoside-diphosphate sugar epimerase/dehydratase, partial [Phycisphaerae bacterium]
LENFWNFQKWLVPQFLRLVWIPVLIKLLVFGAMGLYRGFWRYVGIRDAVQVFKAAIWSSSLFIIGFYATKILTRQNTFLGVEFPESVFILDWGATVVLVIGARAAVRVYYEESRYEASETVRRCLILGAGDTGEMLLREINRMPSTQNHVVGFLDDDPSKQAVRIHDVPVLGSLDDTRSLAEANHIDELLIAMPNVSQRRLRHVVETCQGTNLRFRTVPAVSDVIAGRVNVSQVRDVDINDLLGRAPVQLDSTSIASFLENKCIVVTGAGGSIGSEICRQVMQFSPARVVLIEQAENNLFQIDREMQDRAPTIDRRCYIADVCDQERIGHIFEVERPHAVFHAAAHKHVPLMENNIGEAIKNNVRGTLAVARAADRAGVERFVMISTDKAVNPTSVMGCSKRVAELGIQQFGRHSSTHFITVRFGNVLGSSGSVVPIFREQIARGGPVTVTHPEMTRYFMTIPEATQLVLQAGAMGSGGEIFVLDMGEPVKIVDLARQMVTLSGFRIGEDIEITFVGSRPGEKLFEELSVSGEDMSPTRHAKIYVWRQRVEDWDRVGGAITELIEGADSLTPDELRARLKQLVPEYCPAETAKPGWGDDPAEAAVSDAPTAAASAVDPAAS